MKGNKLRALTAALAVTALISSAPTPALANTEGTFPDVPEDADYAEAVETLAELGVFAGNDRGEFEPERTITRTEAAAVICRMLGVEDEALTMTDAGFPDVPAGYWGAGYIAKAAQLGIINGYSGGKFGPTDPVTKEQMLKMLVCAWGYEDQARMAGGWPDGYTSVARDLGIASAGEDALSLPAKRREVAVWCYNALFVNSYVEG